MCATVDSQCLEYLGYITLTTGPLSRDSTGDHPKEVIGDILMSSKASVNLWHPVLMIHLGLYFMSSSNNSIIRFIIKGQ